MMFYSKEQIETANSRSITEYFMLHGFRCDHSGRETHIRGFGGFYVRDGTEEFYIHSMQKGGIGLISCLMKLYNMTFEDAVREALNGEFPEKEYSRRIYYPQDDRKVFYMPEKCTDNDRVRTYLSGRGISYKLIDKFIDSGLLYQDHRNNAVFLHYKDGVPCGAELHGTDRGTRFKGAARGTGRTYTEFIRGNPEKVYVFESSIDMMSYLEIHKRTYKSAFVSMAGLKPSVVNELLEKYGRVILCVDNDEHGDKFADGFVGKCERCTECKLYGVKDHNELLQKMRSESIEKKFGRIGAWSEKVHEKCLELTERAEVRFNAERQT